jgi:hypothetical protein
MRPPPELREARHTIRAERGRLQRVLSEIVTCTDAATKQRRIEQARQCLKGLEEALQVLEKYDEDGWRTMLTRVCDTCGRSLGGRPPETWDGRDLCSDCALDECYEREAREEHDDMIERRQAREAIWGPSEDEQQYEEWLEAGDIACDEGRGT